MNPEQVISAAKEQENLVRDAAFLNLTETVSGFELRPLTLRDYLILKCTKSPFLGAEIPTRPQLIAFLWLMSPQFRPGWSISVLIDRRLFARRCRNRIKRDVDFLSIVADCRAYIVEAFQDAPFSRTVQPQYFSDACHFISMFALQFHVWMPEGVLSMPVKQLFQFQNQIKLQDQGIIAMHNPSDAVRASMGARRN